MNKGKAMNLTASEVYRLASSSVVNLIAESGGTRVGSGSGFLVNNRLVTCAHVTRMPLGVTLKVGFEQSATDCTKSWSYGSPLPYLGHSDEHSHDFAILEIPAGATLGPSLSLANRLPEPGEPVCALGYPFDDPHLTIHQGIVSAVFRRGPATMLKLNMSVNPSNSGGPLISMLDGTVVGVVARKATGLTRAFNELIHSFEQNARILQAQRQNGGVKLMGIDPLEVLAITQQQMKQISMQIERSANVGIGYAIWIDPLCHETGLNPA